MGSSTPVSSPLGSDVHSTIFTHPFYGLRNVGFRPFVSFIHMSINLATFGYWFMSVHWGNLKHELGFVHPMDLVNFLDTSCTRPFYSPNNLWILVVSVHFMDLVNFIFVRPFRELSKFLDSSCICLLYKLFMDSSCIPPLYKLRKFWDTSYICPL